VARKRTLTAKSHRSKCAALSHTFTKNEKKKNKKDIDTPALTADYSVYLIKT
jgi:hypothetical protein